MEKVFKMRGLGCANCAAKMERAIARIEGVQSASVNFFAQKLTIEGPQERMEAILAESARLCKRIEPGCTILG